MSGGRSRHGSVASMMLPSEGIISVKETSNFFSDMKRIMLFMEYKFEVKIYPTSIDINIDSYEDLGFELDELSSEARVKNVTAQHLALEGIGPGTRLENIDGVVVHSYKNAINTLQTTRYPILANFTLSKHVVLTDVHPKLRSKGWKMERSYCYKQLFLDGLSEPVINDILRRAT
eukprot:TRINITY_DN2970_c0_g1_i1.p1 TRINITY_DN2970_c0_g1~~TRINITY_DN2970_c0_g1_i1.p1  ORF type:complete len:175 (-),score=11.79 TRINITY_DN2970_c0_g1_i1:79-603(-)